MLKNLIHILLPRVCMSCLKNLSYGELTLCTYCRHQIPLTGFNFTHENECDRTFYGKTTFVKASALLYFTQEGVLRRILYQLKYNDQQQLGIFLAQWTYEVLKNEALLSDIDYLVPVPLHWFKRHQRGYNQLDRFSKRLAKLMGWNYRPKLLKRISHQGSQTKKNRTNRIKNHNPFKLNTNLDLTDKNILIVDDLITTGSTMTNCANAILKQYSAHLFFFSIGFRSRFV